MNLHRRNKLIIVLLLLTILGGVAWWQRGRFLAGHYVSRLAQATPADRENWVKRVIEVGEFALPALLNILENGDQKACANAELALGVLAQQWGPGDSRTLSLAQQLGHRCRGFTPSGQGAVLRLAAALGEGAPWFEPFRSLAEENLIGPEAQTRRAAVQFVVRGPLRQDAAVLSKVVPLLKDPEAEVRKATLVALGPARAIVGDDDLLPLLHDPDDGVQERCEWALRSRGLQETHIVLARFITDERPSARMQVLHHLRQADDLESGRGVWLRRLCQDSAPAVRAAAVRAAASQVEVDMRDCLDEMARHDPSPTVRELAGHYLSR